MGVVENITHDKFPKQTDKVGARVAVVFHYNTSHMVFGTIVRDDVGGPFVTVIKLDDGRYVLPTECQYKLSESPLDV